MGTRGTVTIKEDNVVLVRLYNQMDSYPSGLGSELADFIMSGTFVNGLGSRAGIQFNGAGCFAAALISKCKVGPGGIYISPAKSKDLQEYNYTFNIKWDYKNNALGKFDIEVTNYAGKVIFTAKLGKTCAWSKAPSSGFSHIPWVEFKEWCKRGRE